MIYWTCKRCAEDNSAGCEECQHCHRKRSQGRILAYTPVSSIPLGIDTSKPAKQAIKAEIQIPDKKKDTRIIRFTIDGQPIPKARPRLGRRKAFTPAKTKRYEKLVKSISSLAISEPFAEPVFVHIAFYRQYRYRVDIDNLAKAVLDGMNTIAYADDMQVHKLFLELELGCDKPRAEVTITNVDNWTMVLESLAVKEAA